MCYVPPNKPGSKNAVINSFVYAKRILLMTNS